MTGFAIFISGLIIYIVALVVPLLFLRRTDGRARFISFRLYLVASILFLCLSLLSLITNQTFHIELYKLVPTASLSFTFDRLSAFFIFIISVVSLSAGIYSLRYEHGKSESSKNFMASMMSLFVLSMLLVVASANTFAFLFFWEIMSLSSFFLVILDYEEKLTQKSALFYFIMTQMSTVFLLFASLVMHNINGSFDIQTVAASPGLKAILFLSLFVGFGIKAGVVPFHKWLPYAHSASPSNISALMSGVMIKTAIYGMVRFIVFTLNPDLWWGIVILIFGVASALLGVIYALKEHDLKKLLAYHSIENIGIILLGIGLYSVFQNYNLPQLALLALAGGLFHTLNHALFKSLLFLTAGSVVHATKTRNIEEMGGLIKRMPATGILFLIGAISISALPPFNGFVSELMIFQSLFQAFQLHEAFLEIFLFVILALFALTSALAVACFVKAFGTVFLALPRSKEAHEATEVPRAMVIGPAILAALCVLLGIFSFQLFSWAGYTVSTPNMLPIGIILLIFLGIILLVVKMVSRPKSRISETWGCGMLSQNSRMEYTASGFSEPIVTIFHPVYRAKKISQRSFFDKANVLFHRGMVEVKTFQFFEEKVYLPVAHFIQHVSQKVATIQDVDLENHILYAFVAIVILLMLAWWIL